MAEFIVTFGKNVEEKVPPGLDGITRDHYVVIVAPTLEIAEKEAYDRLSGRYARLRYADEVDTAHYPAGEFARWERSYG